MAMTIFHDSSRCIGCHACVVACKMKHQDPPYPVSPPEAEPHGIRRIEVNRYGPFLNDDVVVQSFQPIACLHCEDAFCIEACPCSAISRDEKYGSMVVDKDKCIGCQFCRWVCPYGVPRFDDSGKLELCNLCLDRLSQGKKPACVNVCPSQAIILGTMETGTLRRRKSRSGSNVKVIIIGHGPAAVKAAATMALWKDEAGIGNLEVTFVSAEHGGAYAPMFLVDYAAGKLRREQFRLPDIMDLSVAVITGRRVVTVIDERNQVQLDDGQILNYDRLLIASGASPIIPPIDGLNKEGVCFLNRIYHADVLRERLSAARSVIIIGAGFIGVEAAIAMADLGKKVALIEMDHQVLPQMLDEDLATILKDDLTRQSIDLHLGKPALSITGDKGTTGVLLDDVRIDGNLVLIAVGVKPNIDFLTASHIRVNGGVLVNERMQTSVSNVYAAGDVATSLDPYLNNELNFNYYNALDQARVAGKNLIGIQTFCRTSPCLASLKGYHTPVISIGKRYLETEYEILSRDDHHRHVHERIYLVNDVIDQYQSIGSLHKIGAIYQHMVTRRNVHQFKHLLLDDGFHLAGFPKSPEERRFSAG